MEIRKVMGDILGVIATEDMVEGRMVNLQPHSFSVDFGSQTDLAGVELPDTADEAARARYIVTWAADNRQPPYIVPMPSYSWAFRQGGWDQTTNVPFSATIHLTYPGYKNGVTIPSGTACLAYGAGTYTVPSGAFLYDANMVNPGAALIVSYSGADKGKLQYQATWDANVVAVVANFDSTTGSLTFKTGQF